MGKKSRRSRPSKKERKVNNDAMRAKYDLNSRAFISTNKCKRITIPIPSLHTRASSSGNHQSRNVWNRIPNVNGMAEFTSSGGQTHEWVNGIEANTRITGMTADQRRGLLQRGAREGAVFFSRHQQEENLGGSGHWVRSSGGQYDNGGGSARTNMLSGAIRTINLSSLG